jgi:hypothetical protein
VDRALTRWRPSVEGAVLPLGLCGRSPRRNSAQTLVRQIMQHALLSATRVSHHVVHCGTRKPATRLVAHLAPYFAACTDAYTVSVKQERTTMERGIRWGRRAATVWGCICLVSQATAQQPLTGSEAYRAEKCAGQYTCDEERWVPDGSVGTTQSSKPETAPLILLPRVDPKYGQPKSIGTERSSAVTPNK